MPRYLISFDDGSMDHIPNEDLPEVGDASHAVVQQAKDAGVWIFGGGIERQQATIVGTDGAITDGPVPETKAVIGGFAIIEVSSRAEALDWAARIARSCKWEGHSPPFAGPKPRTRVDRPHRPKVR
jgi:hypothetical protein